MNNEKNLIIYCKYCGALAGQESKCPVGDHGYHTMIKSNEMVVCKYCAKHPGNPTKCPVGDHGFHTFVEESRL